MLLSPQSFREKPVKMKKYIFVAILFIAFGISCAMSATFGDLNSAKKKYPDIFIPKNVVEMKYQGTQCYVFNGMAEQYFSGELAETDAELHREAEMDAKCNLYSFLSKGNSHIVISVSGIHSVFTYKEGKFYHAVFVVPKENVSIKTKTTPAQPQVLVSPQAIDHGTAQSSGKTTLSVPPTANEKKDISGTNNITIVIIDTAQSASGKLENTCPDQSVSIDERLKKYTEKLQNNPADIYLMIRIANLYKRTGNTNKANQFYYRAIEQSLDDKNGNKVIAMHVMLQAAQFEEECGNYPKALKYYRLFIKCNNLKKWGMNTTVNEVNAKISKLLLR